MTPLEESLTVFEIVFYATISIPGIYCLIMHGRPGFMGWLYVLIMCGLRLAGNAMALRAYKEGTINITSMILIGIGLSPLLGATLGILREANHTVQRHMSSLVGVKSIITIHVVVLGGIALAAASKSNTRLLKIGMLIFTIGWVMVVVVFIISHRQVRRDLRLADELKLLWTITVAMPLIGARVIFALATTFATSRLDGGPFAVRVIFGSLPEFMVMILYVASGINTRFLNRIRSETRRMVVDGEEM